jgi:transposase InsO family protein
LVKGLRVSRPDQVWVSDLTYIRLREGFVYLAVILDVFTRRVRGWQLSRSLDSKLTLTALEQALTRGKPQIHHSDQGIQYACPAYVERLQAVGAQISMAEVGCPQQNGHVERLIRTIKEEEVELSEYRDFTEAYAHIGHFLEEIYAKKRIHSALGYLTPQEFETAWYQAQERMDEGSLPLREPKCVQL